MRWFYAFLLMLTAWTGFVQLVLKDPVHWERWDEREAPNRPA